MTADRTPLQALDDAIHEFAKATEREGTVSGWVMVFETSRLQVDNSSTLPLVHGTNYSIGPATSPATAIGLGRYVSAIVERALVDISDRDEDVE